MGRATALLLARAGAHVAVLDADLPLAESVAAEVEALGVKSSALSADVTVAAEAERGVADAAEALGGLDIVVNIVGSASWASLLEVDDETWERDFDVNLKHHLYVSRAAARGWIEAKRPGVICVVASVSGLFGAPNHGAYGAAKAGLFAFVKTAAEEWFPHGIRINAVAPGMVRTPRMEVAWAEGTIPAPPPESLERMSLPEDIGGAILFFVSGLARRVTGQSLTVDGGTTTKFPFKMG